MKKFSSIGLLVISALVCGCTNPVNNIIPTPTGNMTINKNDSKTENVSNNQNTNNIPSPTFSGIPDNNPGSTSDIKDRATFNGKVYDQNGNPVTGAIINAKSIDASVNWVGEAQETMNGSYVFRNAPTGARVEISASKDGWTTRYRTEVLKANLNGNPNANVFNFGGSATSDAPYAIQDEPEINSLKINGVSAYAAMANDMPFPGNRNKPTIADLTNNDIVPSLTGVSSQALDIELNFSEPVSQEDVQNYFQIQSQEKFNTNANSFLLDQNVPGITFTWSNNSQKLLIKSSKPVLSNKGGLEARYMLAFSEGFRDKSGKRAIAKKYFRFSQSQQNDFQIFSVKNDDEDLKLIGMSARDGGAANDTIELTFSEPIEVFNHTSYALGLVDPENPSDRNLHLKGINVMGDTNGDGAVDGEGATFLGFVKGSNSASQLVYSIGKITDTNSSTLRALGGFSDTFSSSGIRNARISGHSILLEFRPDAFTKNDRVILSAGAKISTKLTANNTSTLIEAPSPSIDFAPSSLIADPSGRKISNSNSFNSANIEANNSQRVSTAL